MEQPTIDKRNIIANSLGIKTRKQRGGGSPVEAPVVVKDFSLQAFPFSNPGFPTQTQDGAVKGNRNAIPEAFVSSRRRTIEHAKSEGTLLAGKLPGQRPDPGQFKSVSQGRFHEKYSPQDHDCQPH